MASDEIKARMRRIPLEVFNQGNLAVVDEVVAPDYIEHALPPGFPSGLEGLKAFVSAVRAAFPITITRSTTNSPSATRWSSA